MKTTGKRTRTTMKTTITASNVVDLRVLRFVRHVQDLCAAFGIRLRVHRGRPDDAQALTMRADLKIADWNTHRRMINVPAVIDETTYAVAMHELGHCLHPLGFVDKEQGSPRYLTTGQPSTLRDARLRVEAERGAWDWARANALEWTGPMQLVQDSCLGQYERTLRRLETGRR